MINLMVGSNFDPQLVDFFRDINKSYSTVKVNEIYGSVQSLKLFGSARPDFRIPNISKQQLFEQTYNLHKAGIIVNYTENTPIVNKSNIDKYALKLAIEEMRCAGISRLTLAHPLAMEVVSSVSSIDIEVSTIYAVQSEYQIEQLKNRATNINKICLDVDINRDMQKLYKLKKAAQNLGIEVELLANEFCIFDCVDRVQCYNEHTQVKTDLEASKFKRYPMGNCISLRQDPLEWVRARFILPQHMEWYQSICGIDNFKITGRTHPTEYIKWVVKQYMEKNHEGNLLELWADVKNIKRVSNQQDHLIPNFDIESSIFTREFLWKYYEDRKLGTDREYETKFLKQFLIENNQML